MDISLSLLVFFFMGSTAKREGDFGIFTSCCTKNNCIRLNCHYAECKDSPPYSCEFKTSGGVVMDKDPDKNCTVILPDQDELAPNKAESYNCTLTRKMRTEVKQLTVDRNVCKGKNAIKCTTD